MKAIELGEIRGIEGLRIVEIDCPKPGTGQVLMHVKAAGINYAELETVQGRYPAIKPLPYIMGFEAAGIVSEVGPDVTGFKIGDRVTSLVLSGGYAEYAVAQADSCILIPNDVSYAEATTIPINGLTAYALLSSIAPFHGPKTISIQAAAGGVGVFLIQLAHSFGFTKIIAFASSDEKLTLARQIGADHTINYTEPNWTAEVMRATDGHGVDVVLECVSGKVGASSISLAGDKARRRTEIEFDHLTDLVSMMPSVCQHRLL